MIHGLKGYWRGCKCVKCRSGYALYRQRYRSHRASHGTKLVSVERVAPILNGFASGYAASRATGVDISIICDIRAGRQKRIHVDTEAKILNAREI